MRTDVKLSTKFLTTQNAHQVGVLVTLSGEVPVQRAPINVALVLDRSGSMSGRPLEAAQDAAKRFAGFLGTGDRLTIVTFDDEVHTVFGPAPAGDPAAVEAIERIRAGGSTNLSGGWLQGLSHVKAALVDGVNRVVLLTDGQANQGVVDPQQLTGMSGSAVHERVSTTCIGFGAHFNEDLLQAMAKEGAGNYWYVEKDDQMAGIFAEEIEGLVALAAQNVVVEVELTHPKAAGVSFLQSYPVQVTPDNRWRITLGDCYATSPLVLGMIVHIEDLAALGDVQVASVRTEADVNPARRHRAPRHGAPGARQPRRHRPPGAHGRAHLPALRGGEGPRGSRPPGRPGRLRRRRALAAPRLRVHDAVRRPRRRAAGGSGGPRPRGRTAHRAPVHGGGPEVQSGPVVQRAGDEGGLHPEAQPAAAAGAEAAIAGQPHPPQP